jgi:glycosyltransferase involved in cell wall biosynthesis
MLISILIPCYNAERWIAQAIESALSQSWPDCEVVVVDDGSTDGSLDIIKRFGDRVRWESGANQGGNVARNRLLSLARGEWLQYLDADDYLLPDKIRDQWQWIAAHAADADVVFSPVTLEHGVAPDAWRENLPIPEPHDLWVLLARWYLPQTGGPLWRKTAILDVGGWKPDQPCSQEHELYLRLLMGGKRFRYCPLNGAIYRQWSTQTVCQRDRPELRRRVLEILQRSEEFLQEHGELTAVRRQAINIARFEAARIAWLSDRAEAAAMMAVVERSDPAFRPEGVAAPWRYRVAYRLLGFDRAEALADRLRKIAS